MGLSNEKMEKEGAWRGQSGLVICEQSETATQQCLKALKAVQATLCCHVRCCRMYPKVLWAACRPCMLWSLGPKNEERSVQQVLGC